MQLGKAIGILIRAVEFENVLHADVSRFHAPTECHTLVSRGEAKRLRQARRHAEAVSGLTIKQIRKRARQMMGNDTPIYRRYGFVPY